MKKIYTVLIQSFSKLLQRVLAKGVFFLLLVTIFVVTCEHAMAQIARRGSTTTATKAGGTGTTLIINKPTGVVQGDVMIFTFSGLRTSYPSSPGWTVIKQGQYTPDFVNGLADGVAIAFYKVAGAAEPANYTFSVTAGAAAVGAIMAFSGVDVTWPTPFDAVPPELYKVFANVAHANSITTANSDAAVLMLVMSQATRSYSSWSATSPSSLAEILDANVTNSANNDQTSIGGAWALKPVPGATGTGNVSMSGISETYGLFLALRRNPPPPTITSFSPSSGPVGTSVTITGTNFNSDITQNSVYFGAAKAIVTAATSTSLTVTVPPGSTYENISVCDTRHNTTGFSSRPFIVTLDEGAITFNPKTKVYEGFPYGITAADVDGDGLTDLVSPSGGNLLILPNSSSNGNLSFNSPVVLTVGSFPYAVAFKDINGDDKADLIVANKDADNVSVFKNTSQPGNISFAAKQDFAVGTGPHSIAVSDLDGDGKADIVTANTLANTVSVLRNTSQFGVISFATKIDYATGLEPYWVRIGDIDGNGKADIVFANYASSNISVLRNTSTVGVLAFAARVNFTTGSFPRAVALGDIDGDGKLDIAVANYNSNTMSVFRNTSPSGSITMAARADFAASGGPSCVAIGDVDGDGKPDLAVTNEIANTVSIFKNNSTSGVLSIAAPSDFVTPAKPQEVVVCDINKDGKPDLSVQDIGVGQISVLTQVCNLPAITSVLPIQASPGSTVTISGSNFSNGGTVSFGGAAMQVTSWSKTSIQATLPANVYGGNIAVTNQCLSTGSFAYTIPPKITSFSPESGAIGSSVTISGINFNTTPSQNIVFFGAVKAVVTAATATSLTVTVPAAANYQYISVTNVGGNVTAYSSKPFIVTLNGAITFKNKVNFATNTSPSPAASADFDGDGKPDLVVGNSNSTVSVLRNTSLNGIINFDSKADFTTAVANVDVTVADLDGDGKPDLASGVSA
ncbi:MAG TPA: FG-GAP-like repeat-containing protein, partial [Parafilimonas sp.]|nr:FG-GAP-like repeat-containing protein [Parafilimonas sp.]